MRSLFAALLALALGLLPVGTARAESEPEPAVPMSCHDMAGTPHDMGGGDQSPADPMQDCAEHCLSQVNGQAALPRLLGPPLMNAIRAELGGHVDAGKPHYRDPPDPPPPRA